MGVEVTVGVEVAVGVAVSDGPIVGVAVGVPRGVAVGVGVVVATPFCDGPGGVGVAVGSVVGVGVRVGVGVTSSPPQAAASRIARVKRNAKSRRKGTRLDLRQVVEETAERWGLMPRRSAKGDVAYARSFWLAG